MAKLDVIIAGSFLFCSIFSSSPHVMAESPAFRDRTAELGLELGNGASCWVDVDQDGWTDLICGGVLWMNDAGKKFTRGADGLSSVTAADFDNDGRIDLFSWSTFLVYRNTDGRNFEPIEMPELPPCVSMGACWGDFNGDGFVDLYIGGFEDWDKNITYPNFILMNEAGKSFRLAWSQERYRSRGVSACDFDQDGDLDVYVSNYRLQPNQLWLNDSHGKFRDAAKEANAVGTSPGFRGGHSIGAAWGDFDNDGLFDLFVGNFAHVDDRGDQPKSRFLKNLSTTEKPAFDDRGTCGVFYQESYASPAAGDFDNDGRLDLFFTTVYGVASFGRPNHPVLFRNVAEFEFANVTQANGLGELPPTSQAAWADFDHDGDLDLVTAGKLFENQTTGKHWLEVRLEGDGQTVNRSAIGAQVRVIQEKSVLSRQVEAGTGEGNQNDLTLHFGLDDAQEPTNLEITWPNGRKQRLDNVAVDQIITVRKNDGP